MPHRAWLEAVGDALRAAEPADKLARVATLADVPQGFEHPGQMPPDPRIPGRPTRPPLVHPSRVPRRSLGSAAGRAALVHAVAHIEFNAINLALDAVHRFAGMPRDYYVDWLSVARDEARHFQMLVGRLMAMGHGYGDLPAHDGLWEAAEKTAHDVLVRMALVPRVLEARGLDVTPGMIERLDQAGDAETVAALRVILDEEVRHVAIGSRWFRWACDLRGLVAEQTFPRLLAEYGVRLRPPFNLAARRAAGFDEVELPLLR